MTTQANSTGTAIPELSDDLWKRRCNLLHVAYVTYRYHRKRQRFFDLLDKGTKSVTVLLGATLMGDVLKTNAPVAASAIAGLGLLALVFGYGDRKQAHKELAEQSMALAGRIEETLAGNISDAAVSAWAVEKARIDAKEPPALKTLVVICEHEQAASTGHPEHVPLPGWHRRLLADFVS